MLQTRISIDDAVMMFPFAPLIDTLSTGSAWPASSRMNARVRRSHKIAPLSAEPLTTKLNTYEHQQRLLVAQSPPTTQSIKSGVRTLLMATLTTASS